MKNVAKKQNNIFCCLYHSRRVIIENDQKNSNNIYRCAKSKSSSPVQPADSLNQAVVLDQVQTDEHSSFLRKIFKNWSFYKFNLLYNTKFKYVVLAAFSAYLIANVFVCSFHLKIDIPISQLPPRQSYFSKHMDFHLKDFELGPMIMLNFIKPIKSTDNGELNRIKQLVASIQQIDGISKFEFNWIKEQEKTKADLDDFYFGNLLFKMSLDSVKSQPNYYNDIYYEWVNNTDIVIIKSRIHVHLRRFIGSVKELNVKEEIEHLAYKVFNYSKKDLIIFSVIDTILEQLREIFPSIIALTMILLEGIFLGSLLLVFDLKSILIEILVFISLILSIFSNLYVFGITLNIVTLCMIIMLPALLVEFLSYTKYLFLFKTPDTPKPLSNSKLSASKTLVEQNCKPLILDSKNLASNSSTVSLNEIKNADIKIELKNFDDSCFNVTKVEKDCFMSVKEVRFKRLQFVLNKNINLTSLYLIFISFFAFSIIGLCQTYNFYTLGLFLIITCINTFFHIQFLYPNLLNLMGTCWVNE